MSHLAAIPGCTAQLVSEYAPRADLKLPGTQRRSLGAVLKRSGYHSTIGCGWDELLRPRREECLRCIGESSASHPVLYSGSRFGAKPAPCGSASFCFASSALWGLGSSQNKFESRGSERRSNFFRAPPRKHSLTLGSRALSLASPCVTRAGSGNFNETENTTMYQNKVTLIGFLGNDAEVRTNNDRSLTTLSLATKSSYKKDGKYIEHTEWHRCVVFGKLGEFAATLKKGAHIQIEGELRSREYEPKKGGKKQPEKKTIWEIRVNSILKLDRAANASREEQEQDDVPLEEVAA
jgi:single-strand DNA-binding protein